MIPKKKKDGLWHVDIRPQGLSGPRIRKQFKTKIEANQFIQHCLALAAENKPWLPKTQDDLRRFTELVDIWYEAKGINLKDGVKRQRRCYDFAKALNNPVAKQLTPADFFKYSKNRKAEGIAPKTINNILGYVNAVFNHLHKSHIIDYPNPLANVDRIKIAERELSYLTLDEIELLLVTIKDFSINPHVYILTKVCLSTGARWGEAESLTIRRVRENKLSFVDTKNGKTRSIPVDSVLATDIREHLKKHGDFTHSLSAFRRALKKSGIDLPKGQASHVLRHSFASHFMINGGNILALQRILDHANVNITMRYAHLAPDHLADSITYNPLVKLAKI